MIKYIVRTTLERVLDKSFSQINYDLLIDKEHKIREIFIDQLETIMENDIVLMEDDIILCRNFKKNIETIIAEKPGEIINFFTCPRKWFGSEYKFFVYNQCTYYPKEILQDIVEFFKVNHKLRDKLLTPERFIQYYLRDRHVYCPRPCLVQHIDSKSILNKHSVPIPRRSPFFIDYLEDLGISYEDANIPENKQRLIDYMNEQFKEM